MHMNTEWIDAHFCVHCLRETEHVKFTYMGKGSITCQFCQSTTDLVEEVEEVVKKSFTVVSVDLQYDNPKRRMVQAEIKIDYIKEFASDQPPESKYINVQYPAYEDQHFTAQVEPVAGHFNYKDAREVSKAIQIFIGKD